MTVAAPRTMSPPANHARQAGHPGLAGLDYSQQLNHVFDRTFLIFNRNFSLLDLT
jgi:hypothetical protein